MKKIVTIFMLFLFASLPALGQKGDVEQIITQKFNNFLANVSNYDVHNNFWAEDLVYTSSSGARHGKETIMNGLSRDDKNPGNAQSPYSAENIEINVFENTAILTFTLVNDDGDQKSKYLNSGTFLYRNNDWKVACWQATKAPPN
jgi:hypothetical protein